MVLPRSFACWVVRCRESQPSAFRRGGLMSQGWVNCNAHRYKAVGDDGHHLLHRLKGSKKWTSWRLNKTIASTLGRAGERSHFGPVPHEGEVERSFQLTTEAALQDQCLIRKARAQMRPCSRRLARPSALVTPAASWSTADTAHRFNQYDERFSTLRIFGPSQINSPEQTAISLLWK